MFLQASGTALGSAGKWGRISKNKVKCSFEITPSSGYSLWSDQQEAQTNAPQPSHSFSARPSLQLAQWSQSLSKQGTVLNLSRLPLAKANHVNHFQALVQLKEQNESNPVRR